MSYLLSCCCTSTGAEYVGAGCDLLLNLLVISHNDHPIAEPTAAEFHHWQERPYAAASRGCSCSLLR